jgi:DNA-binding SARP family transcriptional activator
MLRLTTFGGVALTLDGRPVTAAAGWRQRAVLALVAASSPRGMERAVLADIVWPDGKDPRHSLDQLLSELRQACGVPELFVGAPTLHLNPDCITSDVWDFEAALRRRRAEDAVPLYADTFAKDLTIRGLDELQRRLDELRGVYAREYGDALETLARDARSRGDTIATMRWWEQLANIEKLSARVAKELIEACVAAGERVKALKFARAHVELVEQEGLVPDPEILQWIDRLRGDVPPVPPAPPPRRRAGGADGGTDKPEDIEQRRVKHLTTVLGARYRDVTLIAEGGLATRYSAVLRDGAPQRVEIHVIDPKVAAVASGARFSEVMSRVMTLADRHIHPVIDFRVADEILCYMTAQHTGQVLRERLKYEHALAIGEAVDVARDVAAALAHAHARGVRHGDLRPKHIELTPAGAVVSSFGVFEAISGARDVATDESTIVTLGSPTYLSPEQIASGSPTNPRHDVYAFGSVLFQMLAGDPPFGTWMRGTGMTAKLSEPAPRVRSRRETVPPALDEIVNRCLARVPADRYASGEELVRALAELELPPR